MYQLSNKQPLLTVYFILNCRNVVIVSVSSKVFYMLIESILETLCMEYNISRIMLHFLFFEVSEHEQSQ